jgi:hypothetical protein
VKGSEKSLGTCIAAEDIAGNRMDITALIGEEFDIIRKGKPNPNNKWLVRNKQGLCKFAICISRKYEENMFRLEAFYALRIWTNFINISIFQNQDFEVFSDPR